MVRLSRQLIPAIVISALLAGCGGGDNGNADNGDNGADLVTAFDLAAGDENAPVGLQGGRYRLTITENCDSWGVRVTAADGTVLFDRTDPPTKVFFVSDMTPGLYSVEQTVESCDDWSLRLARISN